MMSTESKARPAAEILSAVPYFAGLDPTILNALKRAVKRRHFSPDEVVFQEGDHSQGLYVVASGWLKIVKYSAEGRELVLHLFGPGEVFGAIPVFIEQSIPATAIALERAEVWVLEREQLLGLVERHTQLALRVIEELAQRSVEHLKLAEEFALQPVEARLARYLLEQSAEGVMHRHQWATQAEMAAELGTVPDVLNRALRSFVEEGLIRLERHQIQITDLNRLRAKIA